MLPPAFESGALSYKFYSLAENRVISLSGGESSNLVPNEDLRFKGSSHGWLALYNPRNLDLFLYNPLSRRHVKLPDVRSLPNIPQENLEGGYGCVIKVIISCSPDEPDCRAMIIYNTNSALAFCCPGRSNKWTPIGELYDWDAIPRRPARCYRNLVYSSRQKVFFCITNSDELETWDLQDLSSPRTVPMKVPDEEIYFSETEEEEKLRWLCQDFKHLVVNSDDDLLVVTRYTLDVDPDGSYVDVLEEGSEYRPHKTVDFDIQKYDPEDGGFEPVDDSSLGGLALFIGFYNHSVALSTTEFPELKPNSIYFTDPLQTPTFKIDDLPFGGHDIGIFNFQGKTVSPCYYPCDVQSIKRIVPSPVWFFPNWV
ncbi:hypothetical protein PHJA_001488600 [Phtheirospermum japonicum]|uniref:KIB1-4 beta-propeller domain-containing protein n=1 Tax=Phtheirospermum japonicum TaxID=374723 RepID=A0A830C5J6_9LAMI|nr:hypothetical protein PHJA_001488600 [Phtheirospermum japonicum]